MCSVTLSALSLCRTLVERLIGARLVYRQPSMSRLVSFEYLNRQLVWQELSEFMLFLLPLINVSKVSLLLGVWNMRWSFIPDLKDWATLLGPLGTVMSPWLASAEVCHSLPHLLYCTVENLFGCCVHFGWAFLCLCNSLRHWVMFMERA